MVKHQAEMKSANLIPHSRQGQMVNDQALKPESLHALSDDRLQPLRFSSFPIQPKLVIGNPNDKYEKEADAVADRLVNSPSATVGLLTNALSVPPVQAKCAACEEEEKIRRKPLMTKGESGQVVPTPALGAQLSGSKGGGRPLSPAVNRDMSRAFGMDFGAVRIHTGEQAARMNQGLNARAFTHGNDIYFNRGQYHPDTRKGKKLLGHELTHVVQQNAVAPGKGQRINTSRATGLIQRGVLEGTDDQCFMYAGRPLRTSTGALSKTQKPGGTDIPGTQGTSQNCAGVSLCNRTEWVNWPHMGLEASDGKKYNSQFTGDWDAARYFVPNGCSFVDSSGVSVNSTRCYAGEREIMAFLYRWPIGMIKGTNVQIYNSDFHMIGRDCSSLPKAWESKMDQRVKVKDIRDPWASLYTAYPHTKLSDREIVQVTFCCDCDKVSTR